MRLGSGVADTLDGALRFRRNERAPSMYLSAETLCDVKEFPKILVFGAVCAGAAKVRFEPKLPNAAVCMDDGFRSYAMSPEPFERGLRCLP